MVDKRNTTLLAPMKSRLKILRFGAMGILFAVAVSSVILSILIVFSSLPQLRSEEQKARSELAEFSIDMSKIAFINDRGNMIRKILTKRPYYNKKIDIIESKMPKDVALDGLTIAKKNYTLRFSSKNLASLDGLLEAIVAVTGQGRDFYRANLTSLSVNMESNRFILVVDLITI